MPRSDPLMATVIDEVAIEVCVDSAASAVAAQRGGATRIELCSDLAAGGITPSAGLIELVRSKVSIAIHVMIRPRGGDFCYSRDEFEIMRRDIALVKSLGANGVVLGLLHTNGSVDADRTRELADSARPHQVTFHRAFDVSSDLFRALEDVCSTGADRILTSGGEQNALQGAALISRLVQASHGRIIIMACGGITEKNASSIVTQTGVREVHAGLRTPVAALQSPPRIALGTDPRRAYQRYEVLEEDVRSLREALTFTRTKSGK